MLGWSAQWGVLGNGAGKSLGFVCVGDEILFKASSRYIAWLDSPLSDEEDGSRRKHGLGQESVGCHCSQRNMLRAHH